jgi:hypothetical protein
MWRAKPGTQSQSQSQSQNLIQKRFPLRNAGHCRTPILFQKPMFGQRQSPNQCLNLRPRRKMKPSLTRLIRIRSRNQNQNQNLLPCCLPSSKQNMHLGQSQCQSQSQFQCQCRMHPNIRSLQN